MQIEEKEYDQSFDWRIWKKLFPFMKPFRKYMIIALVFNTLCALVDIALPLFQQYAINHFISGNTTEGIGSFAGTYLVTIIFQTVSVVIFCRCAMVIEMNMAKNMKKACFDHLQQLSFSYYNTTPVGYILARVMNDTGRISGLVAWNLLDMLWALFYVVGIFGIMLALNWKLALWIMLIVPGLVLLTSFFQKRILKWNRQVRKKNSMITGAYNEGITGAQTSKALVIEEKNSRHFRGLTDDMKTAGVKAARRAIPILKEVGITTKVINMKPYKDPDEFIKALGAEEYQKRIDTAENSFMFEIRILEQQYDMHDPESKTKFYNAVAEKLCTFGEKLERDNYIAAVADKYMIGIEDLRRLVNQYGAKIGMAAGGAPPVRERSELRREQGSEKKKENGMIQSQKLLLTWLIEPTGLFPKIEKYISPEDFTEEIYHKAAEILYEQYRNTGTVNPAKIVSMFQNEEEQREIAGLFHATIRGVETEGDKENGGYSKETFEKALKETIVRVKQNSIEYHLKNMAPTDMAALQRSVADKKALEELEKVHISID